MTVTRFVMVEDAELMRMPSPAVSGERYAPTSVQLDEPLAPIHVPAIAQQPLVRFTPPAKDEVAALEE